MEAAGGERREDVVGERVPLDVLRLESRPHLRTHTGISQPMHPRYPTQTCQAWLRCGEARRLPARLEGGGARAEEGVHRDEREQQRGVVRAVLEALVEGRGGAEKAPQGGGGVPLRLGGGRQRLRRARRKNDKNDSS